MASASAERGVGRAPLDRLTGWLVRLVRLAFGLAAGLMLAGAAAAHPMPESRVWVDTRPQGLQLTLQIPLNRLELAFGQPLAAQPDQVLDRHGDALAAYLLQHVGARSAAAAGDAAAARTPAEFGWTALRPTLQVTGEGAAAELEATMALRAPPGADPRRLTLMIDAVVHEVVTHRLQVFLRSDWAGGQVGAPPRPLGELRAGRYALPLDLGAAAPANGRALQALLAAGMAHIAGGVDHLVFVALLLVVAPLWPAIGHWIGERPRRDALRHIAWVVSAFTLGHSLALALAVSGWLRLPAQPVEVAVALTIAVAAAHAVWPLFGAVEGRMALAFGLIHGQAFAGGLATAGLTPAQTVQALLAFNLGIELAQLAVVLLLLPPLLALVRRHPEPARRARVTLAAAAAGLALGWIVDRLGWLPAPAPLAWLDAHPAALALLPAALWLAWGLSWLQGLRQPQPA